MSQPPPLLTAEWRHLLMLQYEIDPGVLAPLVPRGTELDTWQGRTLVSLVGFRFLDTRVFGARVPFHRHFSEVNLRFYVRRPMYRDAEPPRPGVVFVREIVPRRAIAVLARWWYNEPYVTLPMRQQIEMEAAMAGRPGRVCYQWRLCGKWQRLEAETGGAPDHPPPGSEAEFITEHYWGYTAQRDGGCLEYQVQHPRWRIWAVRHATLEGDGTALYGDSLAGALRGPPASAFLAQGSPVAVFRGRRVADS
jgi:uncharacterized protein YqjF (DUF2071 family)